MVLSVSYRKAVQTLTPDGLLLFLTRFIRLFAYGSLSLVLVFYLTGLGFSEAQTGTLFTLTLIGDTAISLYLTTRAARRARGGVCLHEQFPVSDHRRYDRGDKPDRKRSGAVSIHRTGGALSNRAR